MPTPTLVTVHGKFTVPPAVAAAGTVTFTRHWPFQGPTANCIVPPFQRTVTLDENGEFSLQLPATNDPAWTPVDAPYSVDGRTGTGAVRGTVLLDYATPSVELADLLQPEGAAEAGVTYATLAQLAAAQVDLSADIADVAGNVTAVASDLTNLAANVVRASDLGLVAHSFPAAQIQGGTIVPTAGLLHVVRVRALSAIALNVELYVTTGGTSLTSGRNFAALYADNGGLLGAGAVTADQSTAWQSTGRKSMALTVGQGITPNAWYRVAFYANGSVLPTFGRGAALDSSAIGIVGGLSAPYRYSTADSGLTTTMPPNLGAQTAIGTAWWAAIS